MEKLWEDALGKASNGEEIERVAKEAEQLSETLRGKGLEAQADEVGVSFFSGDVARLCTDCRAWLAGGEYLFRSII